MEVKIRNVNFNVNEGNHKTTFDYINTGLWEPFTFDVFDYFTTKNDVSLDLGCWNGVTSMYLANKTQTVYAIDADHNCFSELLKNIALNPNLKDKIKPYHLAISNKKGKVNLFARNKYGESSTSILERKKDKLFKDQIETTTLLDFIEQEKINQVDFIKIDIEGSEFLLLPTIGSALQKVNYPTLYISFHYNYLNENLYAKHINSRFLTKVILKVERILKISFLKNKIEKLLTNIFTDLMEYQYIYSHTGKLIYFDELIKNPSIIKKNELVFTNKEWHK